MFFHLAMGESGQARRLSRRRLASGLGTTFQPAARVPSLQTMGLTAPSQRRSRRPYDSRHIPVARADPSFFVRLYGNVPEKVNVKTKIASGF